MTGKLKARIKALEKAAPRQSGANPDKLRQVIIYKLQKAFSGEELPAQNQDSELREKIAARLDAIRAVVYLPDNGRGDGTP